MSVIKSRQIKIITSLLILATTLIALFILIQSMATKSLGNDFTMFYESVKALLTHKDIYIMTPWQHYQLRPDIEKTKIFTQIPFLGIHHSANLNSPFWTVLILPFALLSYGHALWLWNGLSILCGITAIVIIINTLYSSQPKILLILATMAACFAALPFYINIGLGELGLFIMLLLILGWHFSRKNQDITAGMILGIALSIKLFVGMFLIYFLIQKRWRLLLLMVLSFIGCGLIGFTVVGARSYVEYYSLLHSVTWFAVNWNASLIGFISRLFPVLINKPLKYWPQIYMAGYLLCAFALTLLMAWIAKINGNRQSNLTSNLQPNDIGYSLTLITMLLISPLGWLYYFPVLLLPLFVFIRFTEQYHYNNKLILVMLAAIFLACVPSKLTSMKTPHDILHVVFSYSYLFYSLWIVMILMLYAQLKLLRLIQSGGIQKANKQFPLVLVWLALLPSLNSLLVSTFK